MNEITTVGLDLAKNVFHVVCCNRMGKIVRKKQLRRSELLAYFANLPQCLVGMESCSGAHHWARALISIGHEVKLVPPQYVKAFVRGNKNDYNDALAIAEAVTRPEMRFVSVKTTEQQDLQALHRLRSRRIQDRTALCNQIRGLLSEYGLVMPQGVLDEQIEFYTREIKRSNQQSEDCRRLLTIPGYGDIVASAFASAVGDGSAYGRGRDVSAGLGLVPKQHSSGGKPQLFGISKRGDHYLRSLLVHGARAVVVQAAHKDDRLSRWINRIRSERGFNKAVVALANKLARIGWVILARKTVYQAI